MAAEHILSRIGTCSDPVLDAFVRAAAALVDVPTKDPDIWSAQSKLGTELLAPFEDPIAYDHCFRLHQALTALASLPGQPEAYRAYNALVTRYDLPLD